MKYFSANKQDIPKFPFWTSLRAAQLLGPFPIRAGFKVFTSISQRKSNCLSLGWLARTAGNQRVWHAVDVLQKPAGGAQEIDSRSTCRLRHLSRSRLIGLRQVPEPCWVTESEDLCRNRSTLTLFRIQSALLFYSSSQKGSLIEESRWGTLLKHPPRTAARIWADVCETIQCNTI